MPAEFSAGARLEVRITPADVGKRVSVRRLTSVADGYPTFADTIGVLASWDAGVLRVTRRTGETVTIEESTLVAGKTVPAAPARRPGPSVPAVAAEELEEIAARAWPPLESERLGDWTLRAAGGFTRRANSVLVAGDPGVPAAEALRRVVAWYGERGLTPWLQVPDSSPYGPDLDAAGWTREAETVVRVAPLAPLTSLPDAGEAGAAAAAAGASEAAPASGAVRPGIRPPGLGPVRVAREIDARWLAAYHLTGGLAEAAVQVVTGGASVWFASVAAPGADATPGAEAVSGAEAEAGAEAGAGAVAIGRAVVDGRWALFGAVEVPAALRRRGLATAIMGALARQAYAEGATAAYLQVEADNTAARALYDRLGFTDHHTYCYRRPGA
jgi:ribosomal protein S18 acetylase RimI-like enzyme